MTTLQWPLDVYHQCHMQSLHPAKLPLFQLQPNFDFETLFRDGNDGALRLKQGHPLCLQTASVGRLGMGWGQDMAILQRCCLLCSRFQPEFEILLRDRNGMLRLKQGQPLCLRVLGDLVWSGARI